MFHITEKGSKLKLGQLKCDSVATTSKSHPKQTTKLDLVNSQDTCR